MWRTGWQTLAPYLRTWGRSEQSLLAWAVVIGMVAGGMTVLLKNGVALLRRGLFGAAELSGWDGVLALGPVLGLVATAWFVKRGAKGDHPGPGVPATLHALSRRQGRLKRRWLYSPLVASWLTVGLGGSGGLEAPALQASAAFGSEVATATRRNFNRRVLLIACAAAASLAATFKAPVAAIIFAVEVIMIDLTAGSLVPLLLASLSSLLTAWFLLEGEDVLAAPDLAAFAVERLPFYGVLGLATGAGSVAFSRLYLWSSGWMRQIQGKALRIGLAGTLMAGAILLFPSLYGEGYEVINGLFDGESTGLAEDMAIHLFAPEGLLLIAVLFVAWGLKPVLTGFTVGAGGVAGVFAPVLFGGAVLGYLFAIAVNLFFGTEAMPVGNAVLAGLGGMLAGVLHAPLTAVFLAAEVSGGYDLFVPVMLTAALSFQLSRRWLKHSIYTKELAESGDLLSHDKDQAVLTLMSLKDEVESDFVAVRPEMTLGDLVQIIARSSRNLHPVLDPDGQLLGIIDLQDIRQIMFDRDQYETLSVHELMAAPLATLEVHARMDDVMAQFERTKAWNLPVVAQGKYVGFVSRSRLFSAYRRWLRETHQD